MIAAAMPEPQLAYRLADVAQVTLKGRAFEAGRSFLLPRAMNALNEVFAFAARMQAHHAVVVAHVEAVDAEPEALSKARATMAQSWLAGDPAPWLKQFSTNVPEAERWGAREDKYLLSVALGGIASPAPKPGEPGDPQARAFQTLARVKVDGIAGPVTRGKLLEKYFALSRTALLNGAKPPENGITLLPTKTSALGAGANFTLQQVSDAKKPEDEEGGSTGKTAAAPTQAKASGSTASETEAGTRGGASGPCRLHVLLS